LCEGAGQPEGDGIVGLHAASEHSRGQTCEKCAICWQLGFLVATRPAEEAPQDCDTTLNKGRVEQQLAPGRVVHPNPLRGVGPTFRGIGQPGERYLAAEPVPLALYPPASRKRSPVCSATGNHLEFDQRVSHAAWRSKPIPSEWAGECPLSRHRDDSTRVGPYDHTIQGEPVVDRKSGVSEDDYRVPCRFVVTYKPVLYYDHCIGIEVDVEWPAQVGSYPTGLQRVPPRARNRIRRRLLCIHTRRRKKARNHDRNRDSS